MATDVGSKLDGLVGRDPRVERLASGFMFTEGPLWNKAGGFLLFSDMPGDARRRWDAGRMASGRWAGFPSNKGNGMTYDAEGRLIGVRADDERGSLSWCRRTSAEQEVVASHFQGKELNSPNDVVVPLRRIDRTSPTRPRPHAGPSRPRSRSSTSRASTASGRGAASWKLLVDDFVRPNGLCFSPDEACSTSTTPPHASIRVFDVAVGWRLSRTAGCLPRASAPVTSQPAGLVERDEARRAGRRLGHRAPAASGCSAPTASTSASSRSPRASATFHWGGPDWKWLFVCASTSLYRVRQSWRAGASPSWPEPERNGRLPGPTASHGRPARRRRDTARRGRLRGDHHPPARRAAGVNHGLVHYYFGSMEELFLQVLERFTERLIARQRAMYARGGAVHREVARRRWLPRRGREAGTRRSGSSCRRWRGTGRDPRARRAGHRQWQAVLDRRFDGGLRELRGRHAALSRWRRWSRWS